MKPVLFLLLYYACGGTPVLGTNAKTSKAAFVYDTPSTWNEAFTTCSDNGSLLLNVDVADDYTALQAVIAKYPSIRSAGKIWLGYHEPDPVTYPDIRVWSDCTAGGTANWDSTQYPAKNVDDAKLCVVLDVTTMDWSTVQCNDHHPFVCLDNSLTAWSYDAGTLNTVGNGTSLGPWPLTTTHAECGDMCSTVTYQDDDCWAYAYIYNVIDTSDARCHLYFAATSTFYDANVLISAVFTLYRRQMWTDYAVTTAPAVVDDSIFPYSCCDVSTLPLTSLCPSTTVPTLDTSIPTTEKRDVVLFTNPRTWNEANSVCFSGGGRLLVVDGASKRHVMEDYFAAWTSSRLMTGPVWTGLTQADVSRPCSLRWSHDCSAPDWVNFPHQSHKLNSGKYCGAISADTTVNLEACSTVLQYVCEYNIGSCSFESGPYSGCLREHMGEDESVPESSAKTTCLSAINYDKECWVILEGQSGSATLIYYINPFYCDDHSVVGTYSVTYKRCYEASHNSWLLTVTPNSRDKPNIGCMPVTYQYTSDPARCTVTTTTITTSTTTTPATTKATPTTTTTTTPTTTTTTPTTTTTTSPITTTTPTTTTTTTPTTTPPITETTPTTTKTTITATTTKTPTTTTTTDPTTTATPTTTTTQAHTTTPTTTTTTTPTTTTSSTTTPTTTTTTTPTTTNPTPTTTAPVTTTTTSTTTITPVTTTKSASPTGCSMSCTCYMNASSGLTLEEWVSWIVAETKVQRKSTSRYRRTLTSARDDRPSAVAVGGVAVTVIVVCLGWIVSMDIPIFLSYLKALWDTRYKTETPQEETSTASQCAQDNLTITEL